MSQAYYSLHEHEPFVWDTGKKGYPLSKTNSMITYFDSHTTNTSDVMFK